MQAIIDQFLRTYRGRLKASTFSDYRSILSCHLSRFQDLQQLNQGLEEYLSELKLTGKTKNNIISCAKTFLSWAARRDLIEGKIYEIPPYKHRPQKTKPLNTEEARLVMRFSPQPYKWFFQLSILTGMRTGEALGLRFEDFDEQNRVIKIRRSLTRGVLDLPKTDASIREIPLLRPVWELMEKRRKWNPHSSPWFFYSDYRGIMGLKKIRTIWKNFLKVFGMEPRRLYATRHTFASLALAAGENPLWVAKVLGHQGALQLYERDQARALKQLFLSYADHIPGEEKDGEKFLKLLIGRETFMSVVN
jgi:integrase